MRKAFILALTVFLLATTVQAEQKSCNCHAPTWENLTISNLAEVLNKDRDASIDDFFIEGGRDALVGKTFTCASLVARFMPEEYAGIDSEFDLRKLCAEAKEIARRKVAEFNKCPYFRYSGRVLIRDYNFDSHKFQLGPKLRIMEPAGPGFEMKVPEKYRTLDVDWDDWCRFGYLSIPNPIEKIWMEVEDAEKFAATHDKVYAVYEFQIFNPENHYADPARKMWVYETEKQENLLAAKLPGKDICQVHYSREYIPKQPQRERRVLERLDKCNEYNLGGGS